MSRTILAGDTPARLAELESSFESLKQDLDTLWILLGAFLVFLMQAGFATLEAGSVQNVNVIYILRKNVLDACVSGVLWWAVGYSFAYGEGGSISNGFIGATNFFSSKLDESTDGPYFFAEWLFSWTFATTAATIVSGAVAERCRFQAYMMFTFIMTAFVYPVVVHWVWSKEGWLSAFRENSNGVIDPIIGKMGLIDFAGSGVVHVTGGGAALMGAWILGPREGRFLADGTPVELKGASLKSATLGVFILWFGWYGFNTASTGCMVGCMYSASKAAMNTTVSASTGGLIVVVMNVYHKQYPAIVSPVLNGILAGLVSITAGCSLVEPYGAALIGTIGGFIYYWCATLLEFWRIDDPLEAAPVHFFCGVWGLISVGIFATEENVKRVYPQETVSYGFLYGGGGEQLGLQLLGALAISAWTVILSGILFQVLNKYKLLRRRPRQVDIPLPKIQLPRVESQSEDGDATSSDIGGNADRGDPENNSDIEMSRLGYVPAPRIGILT
ncbi:hypothetical protein BSKO_07146 [Bryopsis sp. KO-2023]|nr:hypothetical protein BSKO_07146 [Bryopsis sp. KO-2023]